jgi:hypothetical protein
MVYNTQNYCVFGFLPSSGILETRKHDISKTDPVSLEYRTMEKVQNPVILKKEVKKKGV